MIPALPALLPALLTTFALTAATPQAGREQLEALQRQQAEREARGAELTRQAEAAAQEATRLQAEMVGIADEIAGLERDSAAAQARLETLTAEEGAATDAIAADRAAMMRTMAALQRAQMRKPPALAVSPQDAADAARAATLLAAIAPALQERADTVRARVAEITSLRAELEAERVRLAEAQDNLAVRRADLDTRLVERAALEQGLRADAQAESQAARAIAREARDLTDLIARLEAEAEARRRAEAAARAAREAAEREARERADRQTPAPAPAPAPAQPLDGRLFAQARGQLRAPAAGRVAARFGQPRTAGSDQGIQIATVARAQVVAPFDGHVEFADEFGNYGRMLILSVGDGYHIVLAGMGRLYAAPGQSVLAGEPVGEMADRAEPAPELYYEIRRNGAPVDPEPWIRSDAQAG